MAIFRRKEPKKASPTTAIPIDAIRRYIEGFNRQIVSMYALMPMQENTAQYVATSVATAGKILHILEQVALSLETSGRLPEHIQEGD